MDTLDIWRTAHLLLTKSPAPGVAEAKCMKRIYDLRIAGDEAGADVWASVLRAVDTLRRQEPDDGELLH